MSLLFLFTTDSHIVLYKVGNLTDNKLNEVIERGDVKVLQDFVCKKYAGVRGRTLS